MSDHVLLNLLNKLGLPFFLTMKFYKGIIGKYNQDVAPIFFIMEFYKGILRK